ncbi:MAG TPA: hypothetical protein VE944_26710 [Nostoc sp.]|uniref:hypothetical protein n=1 Tax=Nostoc sp. TaxID=1180 RepID=UPI002D50FBEB|nr:hypothetical protein [Nostoc sp.]HYX17887.1 hypothetical protein [Nostoc sp.]
MPKKPVNNRPQINIRLDKDPSLLDEIKKAASDRNITASEFLIDAIKSALGKADPPPMPIPSLDSILLEIDKLIDDKLGERLGELNGGC